MCRDVVCDKVWWVESGEVEILEVSEAREGSLACVLRSHDAVVLYAVR